MLIGSCGLSVAVGAPGFQWKLPVVPDPWEQRPLAAVCKNAQFDTTQHNPTLYAMSLMCFSGRQGNARFSPVDLYTLLCSKRQPDRKHVPPT
jgi:hypothetical protein